MEDKIQKLTEKLYKEGIQKAEEEADQIIRIAKEEAQRIVEEAKQKVKQLESDALRTAEVLKDNTQREIQMAADQSFKFLKQRIVDLIITEVLVLPVTNVMIDEDFIKKLILTTITQWKPKRESNEGLLLEVSKQIGEESRAYLKNKIAALFEEEYKIELNERLSNGFRIGPINGNYKISFTDEAFIAYFNQFLRPQTIELLYGNQQ